MVGGRGGSISFSILQCANVGLSMALGLRISSCKWSVIFLSHCCWKFSKLFFRIISNENDFAVEKFQHTLEHRELFERV